MFIGLLVVIILLGVVAALVPMPSQIQKLVIAAAVILFIVWVLALFGLLPVGSGREVIITR